VSADAVEDPPFLSSSDSEEENGDKGGEQNSDDNDKGGSDKNSDDVDGEDDSVVVIKKSKSELTGESLPFVWASTTIAQLKKKLSDKTTGLTKDMRLFSRTGKECEDFVLASSYCDVDDDLHYLYVEVRMRGGMGKRAKAAAAAFNLQPHPEDPAIVLEALRFKSEEFSVFVLGLQANTFEEFKDYVLKCKHGERVLEWLVANIDITKRLEDYIDNSHSQV
jgi:hypothetical protein